MKGNLLATAAIQGYDKALKEMTLAELNNYTEYKVRIIMYFGLILRRITDSLYMQAKLAPSVIAPVRLLIGDSGLCCSPSGISANSRRDFLYSQN